MMAARTKPNIELLKRLRQRFLRMRHEEHFDMKCVAVKTECGTAMCIAGHILDLQGYKLRFDKDNAYGNFYLPSGGSLKENPLRRAAKEIGIPYSDYYNDRTNAEDLFHDYDLRTPRDAAERIGELIEEYQR